MSQFLPRPCRFVVQNTGNELGDGQRAVTTPGYSAPELATTRTGTPASDVYSLGITFYEIFHAAVLKPVKAIKTASSYETGRAFKEYVSSELRSRSIESPFDAFPYLELMSSMTEENPDKRPTLDQISKLLDRSYRKAISGGPSYQVKTVANNYLWNPTIHRVLGEELFYVLIKGGNPVLDFDDIRVDLERTGTTGFSLR
ncbi:MAG: protein kinase, partial [Devosia sp.]